MPVSKLRFFGFFLVLAAAFLQERMVFASDFSHGISFFGDLKYNKNFTHFDYVNSEAPKRGVVRFGVEGGFNNLNQFLLKGISASGLSYLYDSLTESADDEISTRYGLIAKGVRLANDASAIEFLLNEKATFHDGVKITANDVVFTFNALLKDGHPSYKMAFREVLEVKKINEHLVRFSFKKSGNRKLALLIASLPVLPKHYYENVDFSKTTLTPPLGSGPYKIKEVKPNRSIVFERVKNYWAKDLPVNRGRYNFDEIAFDYYRDSSVLIEAFKAQKFDFRQENVARNWATRYDISAIKNGEIVKKEIINDLPAPAQAFVLNLRREKFQNRALREALNYAFDFEWLRAHIFYGSYKRSESFFSNSGFAYKNFSLPKSDGDGFNRKNLLKARQILLNAGYKIADGVLVDPKNNQKVSLEILIDSEAFKMIVAPFVKNLRKLGIDAKARFVEENQYQTRLNNFDFDMVVGMFSPSLIPGDELFSYFHSSQKNIKGARNLAGLDDKEVDWLVEKISRIQGKTELTNLCQQLDKRLLEEFYFILQWHNNTYRILYRNIFGIPEIQPKFALALDSWWVR